MNNRLYWFLWLFVWPFYISAIFTTKKKHGWNRDSWDGYVCISHDSMYRWSDKKLEEYFKVPPKHIKYSGFLILDDAEGQYYNHNIKQKFTVSNKTEEHIVEGKFPFSEEDIENATRVVKYDYQGEDGILRKSTMVVVNENVEYLGVV